MPSGLWFPTPFPEKFLHRTLQLKVCVLRAWTHKSREGKRREEKGKEGRLKEGKRTPRRGHLSLWVVTCHSPRKECKMLVAQSCPTLCNSMDCSPPGFSVHGIFQARILNWLPFPFPEDLPNPGMEARSPALQVDSLPAELPGESEEA